MFSNQTNNVFEAEDNIYKQLFNNVFYNYKITAVNIQ